MLSRAGRRQSALRRLHRPYEQLALPWLSPALQLSQYRLSRTQSALRSIATSTAAPIPSTAQGSTRIVSHPPTRHFATATSDPHGIYIPFEGHENYGKTESSLSSQLNSGFPFPSPSDPNASLIIINDSLITRPKPIRKLKGIGGDVEEMIANLDVSLAVGMFERAAVLVRRLSTQYPRGSPEVLSLHNKYIQMMVSHMIINRRSVMVFQALRWFEVDMQMSGIEPDAKTYGLLLKMSLRMLNGSKRQRTVDRYWKLIRDAKMEEAVVRVPDLSEADLGLLSELCLSRQPANGYEDADFETTSALEDIQELDDVLPDPGFEVLGTEQKGFGLSSLKNTLSTFKDSPNVALPSDFRGTREEKKAELARLRQQQLEEDSVSTAVDRWRKESELRGAAGVTQGSDKKLGALLHEWHQELSMKLRHELELASLAEDLEKRTVEDTDRLEYAPFFQAIGPEKLAGLVVISAVNTMAKVGMDKGCTLAAFVMGLGSSVEEEYMAERFRLSTVAKHEDGQKREQFVRNLFDKSLFGPGGKVRYRKLMRKFKETEQPVTWSPPLKAKIGSRLASMLFNSTTVAIKQVHPDTNEVTIAKEPAFRHVHQLERGFQVGYVHLHQKIVDKFGREPPGGLMAKHLPMLSPPRPWEDHNIGGFLGSPTNIIRVKHGDDSQLRYIRAAAERGDLDQIYEGLNVLGKTGWNINRPVFEVMLEAWNSKEPLANLAPANPKLTVPEKPETTDFEELKSHYREKQRIQNIISGFHSERCFQNFQMEVARTYINETFYLPHNMDFRGRAYPLPPYLNQMSADNCRGLLLFSEGRELGERGLRWLKIHLANLYGFDKASFEEREQFAMEHLDNIFDSAENSLSGRKWWLEAEDPFQCLAACIELTNALKSPEPTKFLSRLPIHQDGSCNGLQHYAALGGDIIGAQQVNLEPSDRPSDIYTAVAEHVKDSISQDARADDKIAVVLQNKITRKVVKQTVMTNVYGVTFLGAVRQVRKQLRDYHPELETSGIIGVCATYIAQKIFSALGSMFTGAHAIQFWLGDCANRITQSLSFEQLEALQADFDSKGGVEPPTRAKKKISAFDPKSRFNSTVVWTTPLKLPVVQPYRTHKVRRIQTCLQHLCIKDPSVADVADRRKQLQAFPPNFIHSLDATHMLLSAIKCDELGLNFSAVHDSFWTHAGDIDTMNRVLRDAFVRMHSEDIVQRLAAEFNARYPDRLYLAKLRPDSPLGKKIIAFRKKNRIGSAVGKDSEALKEYERIKLLSSSDPADQEKGREIVTPASIYADDPNAEDSLLSTHTLGVAKMGHVTPEEVELASKNLEGPEPSVESLLSPDTEVVDEVLDDPASDESDLAAAVELSHQRIKNRKKAQKSGLPVSVWLPLKFRAIPPKGDFDVKRLKKSDYFFS